MKIRSDTLGLIYLPYLLLSTATFLSWPLMERINDISYIIILSILLIGIVFKKNVVIANPYWIVLVLLYIAFMIGTRHTSTETLFRIAYIFFLTIYSYNVYIEKTTLKSLYIIIASIWVILVLESRSYFTIWSSSNNTNSMINPNTLAEGILFLELFILLFSEVIIKNKSMRKVFRIITVTMTFIALYNSGSRMAIASFGIYVIADICVRNRKFLLNKLVAKVGTIILFSAGMLFTSIFLAINNMPYVNQFFLKYTGKNLDTGRAWMWNAATEAIMSSKMNFLFGVTKAHRYSDIVFHSNMHNVYIYFFGCLGLVGYVILTVYFIKGIENIYSVQENPGFATNCVLATWTMLLLGFSENILIVKVMIPICYFFLGAGQNKSVNNIMKINE